MDTSLNCFSVYVFEQDQGVLVRVIRDQSQKVSRVLAEELHNKGYAVKIVDQYDGVVVYTLGF